MRLKVTALLLVWISFHCALSFQHDEAPTGTLLERDEKISNEDESPTGTEGDEESLIEDQPPTGIELKDEETVKKDDSPAGTNGDLGANDEMNKLAEAAANPGCGNYKTLNQYNRAQAYSGSIYCDKYLAAGWYRFSWSAGYQMPNSCVPKHRCGTHAPGWLFGGHPTVAQGSVLRIVCFHWTSGCCHWYKTILVRNCGRYYVYYLTGIPICNLRYCGNRS